MSLRNLTVWTTQERFGKISNELNLGRSTRTAIPTDPELIHSFRHLDLLSISYHFLYIHWSPCRRHLEEIIILQDFLEHHKVAIASSYIFKINLLLGSGIMVLRSGDVKLWLGSAQQQNIGCLRFSLLLSVVQRWSRDLPFELWIGSGVCPLRKRRTICRAWWFDFRLFDPGFASQWPVGCLAWPVVYSVGRGLLHWSLLDKLCL
jgi:hypothetical protein